MNIGKINRISIVKNGYVSGLKNIPSPPLELYVAGTLPAKRQLTVAIIGPRKPSAYGREVTTRFTSFLAKHGAIIVSGLAFGVDSIAHQATLDVGGTTIAVLANGLHHVYPATHTSLAEAIVRSGGALLSEKPLGYEVRRHDFLARNRLISGLADVIFVPEATEKSGTLSTVQHALEQGKDVFVTPGPITSPYSAGSNRLLQQGAHVALKPEDILEYSAPELASELTQTKLLIGDTPLETDILRLIQAGTQDGDTISKQVQAPLNEYLQAITILELKGDIRPLGGNVWGLRS